MAKTLKIYLQDSAFAHCIFSNNPMPPKQLTDKVEWVREDTYSSEDIVVWTDIDIPSSLYRPGSNIAWLVEAWDHIPDLYKFVQQNFNKFTAIWTHDKILLETCPNAVKLPFGGCWIDEFDWGIHSKSKQFSIIALRDYRYHFCIENTKRDYWFTEKLIDCFVTGTIPLYWGCPSIGDFFNTDGMICYDEVKELPNILQTCNKELYLSKMDAIKENFELAKKYRLAEETIPDII